MPTSSPTSAMRLTTNALMAALFACRFSYQKPISRYEQAPTPSQKTRMCSSVPPSSSPSMAKQNRPR